MVASAADAGAGERMLMRQLIRLIETIADMHQARGQARQAAALAAAARTELARVQMYRAEPITAGPPPFTSPRPDRGIGR